MQANGKRKCYPEWYNPDPKVHKQYVVTYKWILQIKYRIIMLKSTDFPPPKKNPNK